MRLLVLLFCFPFFLAAQSLPALTYRQTQDITFFKKIKNRTPFHSYQTKNGTVLSVGDTLVLAQPTTKSSQGESFSDDQVTYFDLKEQRRFEFIQFGKRLIMRNNQFFVNQSPDAYPTQRMTGEQVIIKEIVAIHKGSRKKPLAVYFVLGERNGRAFGIYKHLTVADVENAFSSGELALNNDPPIARIEAIKQLKEAKELLDLEIKTQEEYNAIKAKLTPLIKS